MINKDKDDVFSDSQINQLKIAFKELDSSFGVHSFDQNVQLKILRSHLQRRRMERTDGDDLEDVTKLVGLGHSSQKQSIDSRISRKNLEDVSFLRDISKSSSGQTNSNYRLNKLGVIQFIISIFKTFAPSPKLAMTLAFVSGVGLTSSYYFVIDESIYESKTVRSSSPDKESLSLISAALDVEMTAPNAVENRSQIIESAMRAKLRVIAHIKDNSIVLTIDGLKENDPMQLAFKALTGLPPSQSGAVNLKFIK